MANHHNKSINVYILIGSLVNTTTCLLSMLLAVGQHIYVVLEIETLNVVKHLLNVFRVKGCNVFI